MSHVSFSAPGLPVSRAAAAFVVLQEKQILAAQPALWLTLPVAIEQSTAKNLPTAFT